MILSFHNEIFLQVVESSLSSYVDSKALKWPPQGARKIGKANTMLLSCTAAMAVHLSTITGLCFGIGITFAGTGDKTARDVILNHLIVLQR